MVDKSHGLPVRCGNARKRCSGWIGGGLAEIPPERLRPIVARNVSAEFPEVEDQPLYVRDEWSQE